MANGFERYGKKTRRAEFLEEMEQVVRMLRMYFLQQWFNLSDPAVEEALYGSVGCASS